MLLDKEFLEVVTENGKLRVRIAELDKAAKDAIKEVSYWSTETGKRDARIAELEAALKDARETEKRIWTDALLENISEETAFLFRDVCVTAQCLRAERAALKGEKG